MGTNYYYNLNQCQHCGRSDVLHVGKKNVGWTFRFRAHRGRADGLDIISAHDWFKIFKTHPGTLVDEYGRVIQDPLRFLNDLERPSINQQELEDSPGRRGLGFLCPDPQHEWRDFEGFAFCDREFL